VEGGDFSTEDRLMPSRALKRSTSFVLALLKDLPVQSGVRFASSLAAAALDVPFERPVNVLQEVQQMLNSIAFATEFSADS
jgi:hypothetical protein